MPHSSSAAKRLRQNLKHRTRNRDRTTELKTLKKSIMRALHDGKAAEAAEVYKTFTQKLDRAAASRTIHPNAAARQKGRVAIAMNIAAKTVAPAAKTKAPAKAKAAAKAPAKASAK